MIIAHLSDVHWRGIQRHSEYSRVFENLFIKLNEIKPDIIINCGDTFHTKTQGITPEIIERLSWMFRSLADIAPTYTLLGNHDCTLTNLNRLDVITPIHDAINHPKAHLLKKSRVYKVKEITEQDVYLGAFSPFDQKGWPTTKPVEGAINIALYHGSVAGSVMDNNWTLPWEICEADVSDFTKFDFAFLGDIHKQQFLARRKDKNGVEKPWMAYPGSLIQQNFGEDEVKGFLIWNIKNKNDWNVRFEQLENLHPFITIDWQGNVSSTIKAVETKRQEKAFLPGARFRISSSQNIPSIEARKLIYELKEVRAAAEVAFKYDLASEMEHFTANNLKISKKSLRQDPNAVVRLYLDYIATHASNYKFNRKQLDEAEGLIHNYMTKLVLRETDSVATNVNWSLKSFEFENLFRYGENNNINFENLDGIVGIFGPNKTGKSSIVGALMYTLFNTTDRGPMKNAFVINHRKNYGKGRVRLSIGGDDYVIERQSARVIPRRKTKHFLNNDKTTTTLNLFKVIWDDIHQCEVLKEDNSISRDETDKTIRQKIGTSNDFLLTALSSQGGVDKFIKEGPTERKNILSRFLELDIFKQLEELVKRDHGAIDIRSSMLSPESLAAQIKKTRKSILELESVVGQLDERIRKHQIQKDKVKLWLMHHEKSAAEVDMTQMNDLEDFIKIGKDELKTKQEELENVRDTLTEYCNQLKNNKIAKAHINVKELRQQLDDLDIVKTTLHELKHEFATQENKLTEQKKNVRKLDLAPCGDEYPQCYYIKDAHQDKQRIKKQTELVETLSVQVEDHQGKLEEYVANHIQENLKKWDQLDREEFDLTAKLGNGKKHRDYIGREIKGLKKSIKSSISELNSLQKRVNVLEGKEFQNKREQLNRIKQKITESDKARHENLVSLGGHRERLSGLLSEQEETRSLIEKLKIYDSIQDAFSKTGIPAMVLSSQLPAINTELSKILESVVDFEITLETDVNSNVMDVYIEDMHSRRIIELASGMEKTIASMALRAALINLSSLPKPDILIIDEGFGALDDENIQSCMEMLTFLRSYFKTILIISHVPQIKEVADHIIEIKYDGIESNVQMI